MLEDGGERRNEWIWEVCMKTAFVRAGATAALALTLALGATASAWANGASFFDEDDQDENVGPAFFGFVKETSGRLVPDAIITATIKEMNSSVTVRTNVMGIYRIPGFAKSIDPTHVDIVCSKPGYEQATRLRRPSSPDTPIEVDCTLKKN
jgi:hypothetical protein